MTLRTVAERARKSLVDIQREFRSRDRLVAAMIQRILSSSTTSPPPEAGAVGALTHLGEQEWAAYRAHPWLVAELATTRPPLVPAVLDAARSAIDVFASTGVDGRAALDRYLAFSSYVQGMGLLLAAEQQESDATGSGDRAWWRAELRRLSRTGATHRHPWLADLSDEPGGVDFDIDAAFRDGLRRVVRGLVGGVEPRP